MANTLYNCPYDKRVCCDMLDGCCGCEEFARHLKSSTPSASANSAAIALVRKFARENGHSEGGVMDQYLDRLEDRASAPVA